MKTLTSIAAAVSLVVLTAAGPAWAATEAQAQALGDLQSLHSHQRPAVRISLGADPVRTIRRLVALLTPSARAGRKKPATTRPTPSARRARR